ncbi:hypothetical protein EVG20_g3157 [Dentipellis fragilis]|uniref:Uncharacterized protein n=1 Tax=Dentipellis fragilis TaxID=205917 RepID=A0A4Y9Z7U4_9AGAM|nr:hypothetical protein EVG20_g3157 [Dentipellis fragilis]
MASSPPSSPQRPIFVNSTNVHRDISLDSPPPENHKPKRRLSSKARSQPPNKRVKLSLAKDHEEDLLASSSSEEEYSDSDSSFCSAARPKAIFRMLNANAASRPGTYSRQFRLPTRPVLETYVSSHKSDMFKCHSAHDGAFLTPPYACAYTNAAKRGGAPVLAVATEQGSVHVLDTRRRAEWECEPQRTVFQVHNNGVFDVQWSTTDALFATASGDKSVRVVDPTARKVLHILRGHTSTVKSVVWDPTNTNLLSTGGRDGGICLWDLRIGENHTTKQIEDGISLLDPVMTIKGAHGEDAPAKGRGRKPKASATAARSVTSLLYPENDPYGLVSSGSFDGILRYWDIRFPTQPSKGKARQSKQAQQPLRRSELDPTVLNGSRPRGITSLVSGSGPTAGLLFALGVDSRIHTYDLLSLEPLANGNTGTFAHPRLQINGFYARLAMSPDGRHLASGSAGPRGSAYLFDVSSAGRVASTADTRAVELRSQIGEVGGLDWAQGMLATCADDGTVRVWREDMETMRRCEAKEEGFRDWDFAWRTVEDDVDC